MRKTKSKKTQFRMTFLLTGNEYRQFKIKEDTVANQFTAPAVVPPTYITVTDMDGVTWQYVGEL